MIDEDEPQPWLPSELLEGNVRVSFHPSSELPDRVMPIAEYFSPRADYSNTPPNDETKDLGDRDPWYPFQCEADFDFAEFATLSRLSNRQIDDLLRRQTDIWTRKSRSKFTFNSHRDIKKVLENYQSTTVKV